MALSYISGSVVQGSADAFAVAELATALAGQQQLAFKVREILFELPNTGATNGIDLQACVSRRTKTAFPSITDRDVIASLRRTVGLTTSGAFTVERVHRFKFDQEDDLLVVEDPLFLIIDSASTAVANTLGVRIGYTVERISAVDRLTLLTQSLE